jgi:hypothetical protein
VRASRASYASCDRSGPPSATSTVRSISRGSSSSRRAGPGEINPSTTSRTLSAAATPWRSTRSATPLAASADPPPAMTSGVSKRTPRASGAAASSPASSRPWLPPTSTIRRNCPRPPNAAAGPVRRGPCRCRRQAHRRIGPPGRAGRGCRVRPWPPPPAKGVAARRLDQLDWRGARHTDGPRGFPWSLSPPVYAIVLPSWISRLRQEWPAANPASALHLVPNLLSSRRNPP